MNRRGTVRRAVPVAETIGLSLALWACSDGLADSSLRLPEEGCEAPAVVAYLSADLGEASGIARDPRRDDLFWLHNDSGNEPMLYAVDTAGLIRVSVPVVNAAISDPEDLALAGCSVGWCLYLADIGDNQAVRHDLSILRLPLPTLPSAGSSPASGAAVSPLATYRVEYPGGPRDAEGLVIDAARGQMLIVTKGREGVIELYAASLPELESADGPLVLDRVGRLAVPIGDGSQQYVTAADLSPDGTRLAVRAYSTLYLFPWRGVTAFDTLTAPASTSLLPALEPQGEGVAFAQDGSTVYLASEGSDRRPPQLSRLVCP